MDLGTLLDLSERPLLCSAFCEKRGEIAVGSGDHAVYLVDVCKKRLLRTLYTKIHGHTEWVTCVAYTDDGRVVSGGMDSKICLWRKDSSACVDLIGHRGSISGLACFGQAIASSSYDKAVKLWNSQTARCCADLDGHKAPIVLLSASASILFATGDRGGSVFIWDASLGEMRWRLKKIHKGHITAIRWLPSAPRDGEREPYAFATGSQDGILRIWDLRNKSNLVKERVHGSECSRAAINDILVHPRHEHLVITSGADQLIKVFDQRNGFEKHIGAFSLPHFPYSTEFYGNLLACSCGNGTLTVLDVDAMQMKTVIDTNHAAMRFLHSVEGQLICGGDHGDLNFFDIH